MTRTEEKCFICEETMSKREAVIVKQRGIKTLVKASVEKKDNKHEQLDVESVKVHGKCRKNYLRSSSLNGELRKKVSTAQSSNEELDESSQLSVPPFDFREKCLYCTEIIDKQFIRREKKKPAEKRRKVYHVRSLTLIHKILEAAEKRNDNWGDEVMSRLINTIDLVAAEAMYHQPCFVAFFSKVPASKKRGRPRVEDVALAMEEIYTYLEKIKDSEVSLSELMSQCTEYVPADGTVKYKLKEKYGDNILIRQNSKQISMISFGDTQKILGNSLYNARKENERQERLETVEEAAEIVKQDIQSEVYENTSNTASDEFLNNSNGVIPETLKVFLRNLMPKQKNTTAAENYVVSRKLISISHDIISVMRPNSCISCVPASRLLDPYRTDLAVLTTSSSCVDDTHKLPNGLEDKLFSYSLQSQAQKPIKKEEDTQTDTSTSSESIDEDDVPSPGSVTKKLRR